MAHETGEQKKTGAVRIRAVWRAILRHPLWPWNALKLGRKVERLEADLKAERKARLGAQKRLGRKEQQVATLAGQVRDLKKSLLIVDQQRAQLLSAAAAADDRLDTGASTAQQVKRAAKAIEQIAQRCARLDAQTAKLKDEISRARTVWHHRYDHVFGFAAWVAEQIRGARFDLCLVHDHYGLEAGVRAKDVLGAPLVFDAVEFPEYTGRGESGELWQAHPDETKLLHALDAFNVRRADHVIVGTPGLIDYYREAYGIAPSLVRNCLPFQALDADRRIRDDCALGADDRLILYPNSAFVGCGLDTVVRALGQLDARHHLAVMGKVTPRFQEILDAAIAEAGVAGRVHLLPLREPGDLHQYRSGADAAVIPLEPGLPNHQTCLPNRVFECLAAELPLVVSDAPYIRALVERYGCGTLFGEAAPAGAAQAISTLFEPSCLADARAAVRTAKRELSWENEQAAFAAAISPFLTVETSSRVLLIANKPIASNARVARHATWLADQGHDVTLMARDEPAPALRDGRVRCRAVGAEETAKDDPAGADGAADQQCDVTG